MVKLDKVVNALDREFHIKSFGKDPAFSRFIPQVYDPIEFDWKRVFEHDFTALFNGLMLKGASEMKNVFLAVFPTDSVLERFIHESKEGDFLFMHHPLLMECGDPNGKWGRGFVPIKEEYINKMRAKNLSVYTCHVPLDYHKQLGTSAAIAKALNATIVDGLLPNEQGDHLVLVCSIDETTTDEIEQELKEIFQLPYVDFEGKRLDDISKIAIVAGCGDKVEWMKEAEEKGVQAYITGEIHCHIDNDYGRLKYEKMMDYAKTTSMSLIGVSHSASEYLVKKTLMKDWFEKNFDLNTVLLPQEYWWL
ncbi:Nif3-like dinuclear metal center hexameric protein [Rossellomorea sp. NS-SX7]|uniref:Nif3-like dinuclear metal center hexameric protein n=1 Tax=Rossellomorea sp. NS-SX7 TaxID=3463856 RepID=UPI004058A3A6